MVLWAQPGAGKTTLVKKICYDWATVLQTRSTSLATSEIERTYLSRLQEIDLLLACPLRQLRSPVANILDMFSPLAMEVGISADQFRQCVQNDKVVVIVDGFDELIPSDLCTELYGLLFGQAWMVPEFPLIVTSRPMPIVKSQSQIRARILPLTAEQTKEFVNKYCGGSETPAAIRMREYIENHPQLTSGMKMVPAQVGLLGGPSIENDKFRRRFVNEFRHRERR